MLREHRRHAWQEAQPDVFLHEAVSARVRLRQRRLSRPSAHFRSRCFEHFPYPIGQTSSFGGEKNQETCWLKLPPTLFILPRGGSLSARNTWNSWQQTELLQELLVRNASSSGPSSMAEQEKKMTHTVLAIVSCFTLTQGPSAIVFISQKMFPPNQWVLRSSGPSQKTRNLNSRYTIYVSVVANQLVLTGKMLNVVLFCLTSETFRRRLWQTCRFWFQLVFYAGRSKTTR